MALSKSVNLEHAQTAVPCDACEDETPGEYYCIECKHTLCPPCEKLHRKFTKGHNVVLRTQVADIDITVLTCADHGDQASFHCEKCNIPVCGKCITGKHRGHEMSDLADLFDREKKVLQHDITRMEEILGKLKKDRDEIITKKEKYDSKIQQTITDLETEKKSAMKELNRIYSDKMKDLASIQQEHSSIFEVNSTEIKSKMDVLESKITEYKKAMKKNSPPAVIQLSRRKETIPEIGIQPEMPEPPVFLSGSLQKLGENLGKLQVTFYSAIAKPRRDPLKLTKPTIVSKFKSPLQGVPSLCITKEGDVWLGGHESRELVMVDIKGQVLRRRTIQNRPVAFAAMDCGDVIISPHMDDSRSVSRLLRDGREQHVFDTAPSYSYGVSVTADQKILICTVDGRVVRVNGDGTNVKQIYKASGTESAVFVTEINDGSMYISDCKMPSVVMISQNGNILSRITKSKEGKKLKWPLGLAVDEIGNVLCADRDHHCVYIINQNHDVRELVGRSHGILYPSRLAVDNDNNLWITQRGGNVLIVKYIA